ncbi:hypothetical protein BKA62DRAFT_51402 [Auriculariales sp. MPI-PUGE-AT-0066]|nr:hypothetical protein BKA62DRAFT_51402 [Auriculariales sp. MPI-PUGE-AT-0066]
MTPTALVRTSGFWVLDDGSSHSESHSSVDTSSFTSESPSTTDTKSSPTHSTPIVEETIFTQPDPHLSKPSIVTVAFGVLGGVVAVLVAIFVFFWLRRRRRQRAFVPDFFADVTTDATTGHQRLAADNGAASHVNLQVAQISAPATAGFLTVTDEKRHIFSAEPLEFSPLLHAHSPPTNEPELTRATVGNPTTANLSASESRFESQSSSTTGRSATKPTTTATAASSSHSNKAVKLSSRSEAAKNSLPTELAVYPEEKQESTAVAMTWNLYFSAVSR